MKHYTKEEWLKKKPMTDKHQISRLETWNIYSELLKRHEKLEQELERVKAGYKK